MSKLVERKRLTLISSRENAELVRSIVLENDLFDPGRSIHKNGSVHFPILLPDGFGLDRIRELFGSLAEVSADISITPPRTPLKNPYDSAKELLSEELAAGDLSLLPDRWERIGDCLIMKLPDQLRDRSEIIARAYQRVLGCRYSLLDRGGIRGELREPDFEVITAPKDHLWEVVHREGAIEYLLDPRKVMFSSGNVDERLGLPERVLSGPRAPRFEMEGSRLPGEDEIVLDMFAGIGYFSLPLAARCSPKIVISIEKNPVSYGYLVNNTVRNGLKNNVLPVLGDNRTCSPGGIADRLIMGYVGGTAEFLGPALSFSRPEG
ncbi:MAG: class I SAM-dependent methyltransferase, partial [Thermoplasmatota archaeon]